MKSRRGFFGEGYGFDSLSIFLLILSIILNLPALVKPGSALGYCSILGLIPLIVCIWRAFSKNYEDRLRANIAFLDMIRPITKGIDERKEERQQKKLFKFFNCPACRARIRVPKGKGRIEITCPNCNLKFIKKT